MVVMVTRRRRGEDEQKLNSKRIDTRDAKCKSARREQGAKKNGVRSNRRKVSRNGK